MNPEQIVQAIHRAMRENGYSQSRLAEQSGVMQSTISRSLRNPKRVTKTHRRLCEILEVHIPSATRPPLKGRHAVVQAALDAWDGTEAQGVALVNLLNAARAAFKRRS